MLPQDQQSKFGEMVHLHVSVQKLYSNAWSGGWESLITLNFNDLQKILGHNLLTYHTWREKQMHKVLSTS